MTYQDTDWTKIENFIGYGRRDAPVVFIGMEEGAASDGVIEDLKRRSIYPEVHQVIPTRRISPTWNVMCDLMLRWEGVESTLERRRQYQMQRLGRSGGDTLLTELLPYPHRNSAAWDEVFKERFPTRAAYVEVMVPRRKKILRDLLWSFPREAVIGYGKGDWPHFKDLIPSTSWRSVGPFITTKVK